MVTSLRGLENRGTTVHRLMTIITVFETEQVVWIGRYNI